MRAPVSHLGFLSTPRAGLQGVLWRGTKERPGQARERACMGGRWRLTEREELVRRVGEKRPRRQTRGQVRGTEPQWK